LAITRLCVPADDLAFSSTMIRSAWKTVFRRWAMVMTVRRCSREQSGHASTGLTRPGTSFWIEAELGSSRIRIGVFQEGARQGETLTCPPLVAPASLMTVHIFRQ
jgi:hypothetical protein